MEISANPFFLIGAAYFSIIFAVTLFEKENRKNKNRKNKKCFLNKKGSLLLVLPVAAISVYIILQGQDRPDNVFGWVWSVGAYLMWTGIFGLVPSFIIYAVVCGIRLLLTPKWMGKDEAEATRAILKVSGNSELQKAAANAPSFRVRAIALEKLGKTQESSAEIAINEPDEAACRQAIDRMNGESLLTRIVCDTGYEYNARYALQKIQNKDTLRGLKIKFSPNISPVLYFELCRKLRDAEDCVLVLQILLRGKNEDLALQCMETVKNDSLLAEMFLNKKTENISVWIAEHCKGQRILTEKPLGRLGNLCCPDGTFHDYEDNIEYEDQGLSDDDDMKAHKYYKINRRVCRNCGAQSDVLVK